MDMLLLIVGVWLLLPLLLFITLATLSLARGRAQEISRRRHADVVVVQLPGQRRP